MSFAQQTHHMEGNQHFADAVHYLEDGHTANAQVAATLALAFEQRTATLVAVRADSKHGFIRSIEAIQQRVMGGLNLR